MLNQQLITALCLPHNRPKCYVSRGREEYESSVAQMIEDLQRLAHQDGCIAAAWALVTLEKLTGTEPRSDSSSKVQQT